MIENPVFVKEIKSKMRSRQPRSVTLTIVGIIGLIVLWCYYEAISWLMQIGGSNSGRAPWQICTVVQAFLIWILGPAVAANAITQEREQQTWEMMISTLLTPMEILLGKLAARLLPLLGILALFLPFMLFCLGLGGLEVSEFLLTYVLFGVWTLFLVTLSLFTSWAFKRTAVALAVSYLVVIFLSIGTALIAQVLEPFGSPERSPISWLNPFLITAALLDREHIPNADSILLFSQVFFVLVSIFLFWRMVARFRTFSVE